MLAVPRRFASRLLGEEPSLAAEFHTGAWLVANLTLTHRPRSRGFSEAWDNVVYGAKGLGYVVATHQLDRHGGGAQASVWTYYLPLSDLDASAGRVLLEAMRWEDAVEIVLSDLERAHPDLPDCLERLDAWAWGHAMIRPRPGFMSSAARRRAAEPAGDVHFAHSDLSGMALFEEALWQGVRAAEEILARRNIVTASLL